jgi:hypothetical protein
MPPLSAMRCTRHETLIVSGVKGCIGDLRQTERQCTGKVRSRREMIGRKPLYFSLKYLRQMGGSEFACLLF